MPESTRVVSGEVADLKEDDIRMAFEKNLPLLEEGLEYVDSEVQMGTGRIDTLAIDDKSRTVFIEYKRRGEFDKEALVQLMDYLSWFVRDETHIAHLEKHIKKKRSELEKLNPEIRMICVVSEVEDRVKNACYVISNPMQIVTYTMIKDEKGDTLVVPRIELDNTERVSVTEEFTENEMVKEYPNLADIYHTGSDMLLIIDQLPKRLNEKSEKARDRTNNVAIIYAESRYPEPGLLRAMPEDRLS